MAAVIYTRPGGWSYGRERPDVLNAIAKPIAYSSIYDSELPEKVDPRSWMTIEDQRDQGACRGHSLSTGIECVHALAGGSVVQLSRACAYYQTQRIDGITGDNGSTIAGGIELAMTEGICEESVWPYPSYYDPRIPAGYESSTKWKISGHSPIRNYHEVLKHIGIHGAVDIGILWSDDIDRQVARDGIIRTYRPSGGGHAIILIGYLPTDWDGRPVTNPLIMLFNSWSTQWGRSGVCLVTGEAIQSMIGGRMNVFAGLHGAPHPSIQPPAFKDL